MDSAWGWYVIAMSAWREARALKDSEVSVASQAIRKAGRRGLLGEIVMLAWHPRSAVLEALLSCSQADEFVGQGFQDARLTCTTCGYL